MHVCMHVCKYACVGNVCAYVCVCVCVELSDGNATPLPAEMSLDVYIHVFRDVCE